MKIDYDDQADVLYFSIRETGRPVLFTENEQGQVLRIDPETGDIVGFTIPMFSRRARQGEIEIGPPPSPLPSGTPVSHPLMLKQ